MTTAGITRVSGIVLAGGQSTRFGADKLTALLEGRPLVLRPIEALASVCQEIVVVVGAQGMPPLPGGLDVPLRIVRDEEAGAGPLAGLVTGLEEAAGSVVLVAAGDMPGLVPALLVELARRACTDGVEAAALREGERLRPLPSAMRREVALARARHLRATGASSLRALLAALQVDVLAEPDWRVFDADGTSLLDVDLPEDLIPIRERLRARTQ
jgi:molybdopterin-guanine dinucleotide biosynthesis protein A